MSETDVPRRSRKGGASPSTARARRPLAAFVEMRRRFGEIDEILAEWLSGTALRSKLLHQIDLAVADTFLPLPDNVGEGTVAAEEAVELATLLQRFSQARGALAAHERRLGEVEDTILYALMGADLERRIVPAYMAEFVARLQAAGILQRHVRDLSQAKLRAVYAVLTAADGEGMNEAARDTDISETEEVSERGLWDAINVSELGYEIVEREPTRDEEELTHMKLPTLATIRELGAIERLPSSVLRNIEEFHDVGLMIDLLLPAWERQEGVSLTSAERRAWAFLMVVVPNPEKAAEEDTRTFFDRLILPGPYGSSTIREVRTRL